MMWLSTSGMTIEMSTTGNRAWMNNMVNLPQYTEVLTANGCLQDKEYANYSLLSIPLSGSDTSYSSYLYTSHADTSPTKSYMCCALKSHTINQSSLRVDIFVIGCTWLDETHDKESVYSTV